MTSKALLPGSLSSWLSATGKPLLQPHDYMTLAELVASSDFTDVEQYVIINALDKKTLCDFCFQPHPDAGEYFQQKSYHATVDKKLQALAQFIGQLICKNGQLSLSDIQAFLDAGYYQYQVVGLTTAYSLKIITNFSHHIGETSAAEK